jgi:NADPH:quinone reductase
MPTAIQRHAQKETDAVTRRHYDTFAIAPVRFTQVDQPIFPMRSIRVEQFGEPEVMKLADVATPRPAAGQILVRIHAAGVNPADTYVRSGTYARKPALPYTPGYDGAGVIDSVGAGVTSFRAGERVYLGGSLMGTYAEFAVCDPAQVHPLPEKISFAQGAAIGIPYTTAWRALHQRAMAVAGESVLVHGASGGVGLAALQIARAAGLRVFGTAGTDRGRQLLAAQGAHGIFDHHATGYLDQIRAATNGRGVDIILEMLANVNLAHDLGLVAPRGRVIVIGNRGTIELNARDAMMREADIRGMLLFNATSSELAAAHAALGAGLESGTLCPIVGREMPLADAPAAHRAVMEPGAFGKIVLVP